MEEILRRAFDVSTRCNRQSVVLEDVLFVVRKSPIRVQRLARYDQSDFSSRHRLCIYKRIHNVK